MRIGVGRITLVAALAAAAAGIADRAAAQVVRSPDEVRACLCKEQLLADLKGQVQTESRTYEDKRRAFEALDDQVRTSRPQVNVSNQADVDAFKRLLEERDAAADALAGPVTKSYGDAVQRYNQAVADYNNGCAGRSFDPDQVAELKRDLTCPRQ